MTKFTKYFIHYYREGSVFIISVFFSVSTLLFYYFLSQRYSGFTFSITKAIFILIIFNIFIIIQTAGTAREMIYGFEIMEKIVINDKDSNYELKLEQTMEYMKDIEYTKSIIEGKTIYTASKPFIGDFTIEINTEDDCVEIIGPLIFTDQFDNKLSKAKIDYERYRIT